MKLSQSRMVAVACGILLFVPAGRANILFNLVADPGTPQSAVDAFALAADRWSAVLADPITVNVNVGYVSLPAGVVAQTANSFVQEDYSSVSSALNAHRTSALDVSASASLQPGPSYSRLINHTTDNPNGANSSTPYVNSISSVTLTRANAKALGLIGSGAALDATVKLNSSVAFDMNPSDGTTPGQYDFATVAAHELGHVLGFVSVVSQIEQVGGPANALPSTALDLFRYSSASLAAGSGFSDVTADTRSKSFSATGGVTALAQFATGALYGTGYQADHWQEFTWAGLMDPAVFPGLQRQISQTDARAFDVIGYTLVPEPGAGALLALGLFLRMRWGKSRS